MVVAVAASVVVAGIETLAFQSLSPILRAPLNKQLTDLVSTLQFSKLKVKQLSPTEPIITHQYLVTL